MVSETLESDLRNARSLYGDYDLLELRQEMERVEELARTIEAKNEDAQILLFQSGVRV